MQPSPPAPPDPLRRLSDELGELATRFGEHPVTLREVMEVLGGRAALLLCTILGLPFCAPITIPGLSVPFGAVIAVLALGYTLGRQPWLPARLLDTRLPPRFFRAVLAGAGKFIGWIERRLRPRWPWLTQTPRLTHLHGAVVLGGALLLLLPLGGIPFTNTLPALAVVLGALGIMERDGLAIGAAYGFLVGTLVYFGTFAVVIWELFERVWLKLAGG